MMGVKVRRIKKVKQELLLLVLLLLKANVLGLVLLPRKLMMRKRANHHPLPIFEVKFPHSRHVFIGNPLLHLIRPPGHFSRSTGVDRSGDKWQARISIDGKQTYLGSYVSMADAAKAYDE